MTTATLEKTTTELSSSQINASLHSEGYCVLPNACQDLTQFNALVSSLCGKISFDPARERTGKPHQLVNAGADEIGLHIENGNTPNPPRLVAFYCEKAATVGSQTTVCDGAALLRQLSKPWLRRLSVPMTITRTVPANLWLQYMANEYDLKLSLSSMNAEKFDELVKRFPKVDAQLQKNGDLLATIQFNPIRQAAYSHELAFANALLGPSVNYESPVFKFADGTEFTEQEKHELAQIAEQQTREIAWCNGDVVLIDNWRVMHGRRAIVDPNRTLHIAMGELQ